MQVPLEVTFRHLDRSDAVVNLIEQRVDKLTRFHPEIIRCRAIVERPHQFESSGNPYRLSLEVSVAHAPPVIVTEQPGKHSLGEPLQAVVQSAFESCERALKKTKQRQSNRSGQRQA